MKQVGLLAFSLSYFCSIFLSAKKLHLVWNTFNSLKHCSTLTQSSDLNPGFILYRNAKVSHQKHKAEKTLVLRKRDRMEGEWC